MTWDYLKEETDYRLWPAVGYLKSINYHDKVLVDLDCLEGRLSLYLEDDDEADGEYIGNDVVDRGEKCFQFWQVTDEKFANILEKCDILCVFGYAKSDHELESQTLDESILKIIDKCKPESLILECCVEYVERLVDLMNKTGYKIVYRYLCNTLKKVSHQFAEERYLFILEKK